MTVPAASDARCVVMNGDRLPAASGGQAALCAAIERATAARGLVPRAVKVVVGTRSLTADVTLADGRELPPVSMAESDRPIADTTFIRFGKAVADHIAGASR